MRFISQTVLTKSSNVNGEGNGILLQYSCLENPRDQGNQNAKASMGTVDCCFLMPGPWEVT